MAFQAVPLCAEIDMLYTLNNVPVQNVFYAKLPTGYIQTDLQALADLIDAIFLATIAQEMPPESVYVRTEVRGLGSPNDLTAQQNAGAGVGVHAGNALPNNVTFAIKKTSGLTGRSARGRTYWIGIPNGIPTGADENYLQSTWVTNAVADIDYIRTQIATLGLWEPALISRWSNGVKRTEGEVFPWVGTVAVDERIDTHRGRLP